MKNLRVVIDTNVFIAIAPSRSKHHWLFECIVNNQLTLLLSSDIILEYEEQFGIRYQIPVTNGLLQIVLVKKNTVLVQPYYFWNLVAADADDNKFVDCAVAGDADYLITNDRDFDAVKKASFPKVNVVSLEEFETIWKRLSAQQADTL